MKLLHTGRSGCSPIRRGEPVVCFRRGQFLDYRRCPGVVSAGDVRSILSIAEVQTMSLPVSVAVVGCGAIADSYYFPVLSKDAALRANVWLVEPSPARRQALVAKVGIDAGH